VEIKQHGARCSATVLCPEGEDSGVYTCFAYNDCGHTSCQAQLTVEEGVSSFQPPVVLSLCSTRISSTIVCASACATEKSKDNGNAELSIQPIIQAASYQ